MIGMGLKIRRAFMDDIDAIMKVEESSFAEGIREERKVFLERIRNCPGKFLVYLNAEGTVSGYICAETLSEMPKTQEQICLGHAPQNCDGDILYVSSFALLPAYRGRGNGSLLWDASIDYFMATGNYKKICLLVNADWTGAKRIYEKSGFALVRTFSNFFETDGKKSDGLLMERKA